MERREWDFAVTVTERTMIKNRLSIGFNIYLLILFFSSVFLLTSCSDTETTINTPKAVGVHDVGFADSNSPNFHANYIRTTTWNLTQCKTCHADDYLGGTAKVSCKTSGCHTSSRGPEACNTCHGNLDAAVHYNAPPRAIGGETSTLYQGVGVHYTHLADVQLGAAVLTCTSCHPTVVPGTIGYVKAHINGVPAEMTFSGLALTKTNTDSSYSRDASRSAFEPAPQYSFDNATCANTYCHGYFKNGNVNNVISWVKNPSNTERIKCGSCHGNPTTGNPLPGGTHTQATFAYNCSMCHTDEVSSGTSNWQIIDKTKHINGKLNVFGAEQRL